MVILALRIELVTRLGKLISLIISIFPYVKIYIYIFFFKKRWKGENVATSEVEAVISNIIGYKDAIVFGVEV